LPMKIAVMPQSCGGSFQKRATVHMPSALASRHIGPPKCEATDTIKADARMNRPPCSSGHLKRRTGTAGSLSNNQRNGRRVPAINAIPMASCRCEVACANGLGTTWQRLRSWRFPARLWRAAARRAARLIDVAGDRSPRRSDVMFREIRGAVAAKAIEDFQFGQRRPGDSAT